MSEPLSVSALIHLIVVLRRMEVDGKGWTVGQTAKALAVSRDFIYDCLREGKEFERLPGPRPARISARSILLYLKHTYNGGIYFHLFE